MASTLIAILTTLIELYSMCIVGTRRIASPDTARSTPATTRFGAYLVRDLGVLATGASPAGSAPAFFATFSTTLPTGTTRAAPTATGLIHSTGATPANLHIFLFNGPLDNDAGL